MLFKVGGWRQHEERANLLKKGTVLMVLPFWELLLYSNCPHARSPPHPNPLCVISSGQSHELDQAASSSRRLHLYRRPTELWSAAVQWEAEVRMHKRRNAAEASKCV